MKLLYFLFVTIVNGWQFWESPINMTANHDKERIYEFELVVQHAMTMTTNPVDSSSNIVDYSPENQSWTRRDPNFRTKCSQNETILDGEHDGVEQMDTVLATILQYDGRHRKVITINGKSPADTIVVPFGAKVILRVKNQLMTQAITLHVHGMRFIKRWWSDGVPYLQQCPIAPGSDYTYRFIADTAGTLWFHGHLMGDRSAGFLGGFVVLRPDERERIETEEHGELAIGRQYYAIVQNWSPEPIEDSYLDQLEGRIKWMGYNVDSTECIQPENAGPPQTGAFFGWLNLGRTIINQKGWHREEDIRQRPSQLPLANFAIKKGENIQLRLVNGGSYESYYLWVEEHDFWVIAADGSYVKPKKVDSILIHPGERYDVLIRGLQSPTKQPYYIIFESLDRFMKNASTGEVGKNYGLAALRYQDFELADGDRDNVDWYHQKCTTENPCQILNCPHAEFYTKPRNYSCITNNQLENGEANNNHQDLEIFRQKHFPQAKFHELILNVYAGLNGWYYKKPSGIPHFHKGGNLRQIAEFCNISKCDRWEEDCRCFHYYEFGIGNIVQITVATWANMPHPFHLHGTKFYVMKTGLMGDNYAMNDQLECADESCLELKWKNASFYGGNIPGMNANPVLRDTVMVPNKGYAIIRFRASNPGWFFGHCHLLFHTMDGMAFAYKVDSPPGRPSIIPSPPSNFPQSCGQYDGGEEEWWW